jgi:hypothetical protein
MVMSDVVGATGFVRYVRELRALNRGAVIAGGLPLAHVELAHGHLDGRAGRELRSSVALAELRRLGAFFTGDRLADFLVGRAGDLDRAKIVDPACGCGDLLLAAARKLPIRGDLESTLNHWGQFLHGVDRVPEFVEVTRQRLMLLALLRGARMSRRRSPSLIELFPNIVVDDGRKHSYVSVADIVLLNPPYGRVEAPSALDWTSGLVTESALWIAEIVEHLSPGARLIAALPDVLRSGSRYAQWRDTVAKSVRIEHVDSVGQFDALTDVDVFVVSAKRGKRAPRIGWPAAELARVTVGHTCGVMVGPVVDRRDPHEGPFVPYVTTRDLPQSGEFVITRKRRFSKRLFRPPFVVVRRTSRPTLDQPRLRPVVIRGTRPVAVENHLVVLEPTERTLDACHRLSDGLIDKATTDWLNDRIRTRHLTVSAVRDIPANWDDVKVRAIAGGG